MTESFLPISLRLHFAQNIHAYHLVIYHSIIMIIHLQSTAFYHVAYGRLQTLTNVGISVFYHF